MKTLSYIILAGFISAAIDTSGQTLKVESMQVVAEKIIKSYFAGWEKKDWETVASNLADGFTFTSPAPDDHINIDAFKAKCWVQAEHIRRFDFIKITGNEKEAFAIVHVITNEDKIIRNTEYFKFEKGKIKSIEVFFGGSGQGFPTNVKQ